MKTPGRKACEIDIESETETRYETKGVVVPDSLKVQRVKNMIGQDADDIIELEGASECVGVGRDPEKYDQKSTSPCR